MIEAFKTYDKESNGIISGAQIRQLLMNMGDTLTEEGADTILTPHEDEKEPKANMIIKVQLPLFFYISGSNEQNF